jgi:hypothetical protein
MWKCAQFVFDELPQEQAALSKVARSVFQLRRRKEIRIRLPLRRTSGAVCGTTNALFEIVEHIESRIGRSAFVYEPSGAFAASVLLHLQHGPDPDRKKFACANRMRRRLRPRILHCSRGQPRPDPDRKKFACANRMSRRLRPRFLHCCVCNTDRTQTEKDSPIKRFAATQTQRRQSEESASPSDLGNAFIVRAFPPFATPPNA